MYTSILRRNQAVRGSLLLLAAALLQAQQPVPANVKGLPNFHRVNDHVYRGGQPTADGLAVLRDMGIKTVLNLRPSGEQNLNEEKLLKGWGITYLNISMPAVGAPTRESVAEALAVLNTEKDWPVFVHCLRGADRTGTVVACYRIQADGWTNQRAKDEAEGFGLASFQTGKKHFILTWEPPPAERSVGVVAPLAVATGSH